MTWLDWARRLQAVAQNGLLYDDTSAFHVERYEEVGAIAAELAAAQTGEAVEDIAAAFAVDYSHATPKVDVRGAAFRGSELLLVRGADDVLWTLPGGWAEVGEPPREAIEKELVEETGYPVRATKLIGVYARDLRSRPRWPTYVYNLFFLCELLDGEPGVPHAHEISEVGFFAEDALPPLSVIRGMTPDLLARVFEHHRDPALPADFD